MSRIVEVDGRVLVVQSVQIGAKDTVVFAAPLTGYEYRGTRVTRLVVAAERVRLVNPAIKTVELTVADCAAMLAATKRALLASPEHQAAKAAERELAASIATAMRPILTKLEAHRKAGRL